MNVKEAERLYEQYKKEVCWNYNTEYENLLLEVTEFLAEKTNDPWYTSDLGAYYYGKKKFDLAKKYYERTYELGDRSIAVCLGYIWYYGRTGVIEYEKAFHYFSEAAALGDCEGKRKLADMYKNGYWVKRDYGKYCAIIEELYKEHLDDEYPFQSLPDICVRLAGIRKEAGRFAEAAELYRIAKEYLAMRLRYSGFFGDINIMEGLIKDLYAVSEPDYAALDIFDLFHLLKEPGEVTFRFQKRKYRVSSVIEDGEYAVAFDHHWYRSINDLFQKARLNGKPLYARYEEIYDVEADRYGAH